jgi:hypothetical protein
MLLKVYTIVRDTMWSEVCKLEATERVVRNQLSR